MFYSEARRIYNEKRKKDGWVKVANNTWLGHDAIADNYLYKLHNTVIVTINSDGSYTLRTGGWRSTTTKQRINRFQHVTGGTITQRNGTWYWNSDFYPEVIPFEEGMRVMSGEVL
jgi:hypothetical protein